VQLEGAGIARASIAEFFSPAIPVVLPTFIPNPLVAEETAESTGYIDVSFAVTRFGRSRRVTILDSTPDVTRADEDRLVQRVKRRRFRPRVTDGVLGDSPPITVRYYLNGSQ
jgi:hypothetical protein